jgi:hypothetical protein
MRSLSIAGTWPLSKASRSHAQRANEINPGAGKNLTAFFAGNQQGIGCAARA